MSGVMVKISVIMAVYNAERFLADAIRSVLDQSLREIELLCVNDGSTDDSLAILHEFAGKDSRIRVFSQENQGASYTRNVALAQATGEYLHILDGDDMVPASAYERMYGKAKENELDVLFFDAQALYDDASLKEQYGNLATYYKREKGHSDVMTGEELFYALSADNTYRSQASMYLISGEYQRKKNIVFYEGIVHEDNLFTFLCIMKAGRAAHINEPLFIRRLRADSIMTKSVTHENVEGLLTCFAEMYLYAVQNIADETTKKAAVEEISAVAKSGIWKYSLISEEERERVINRSFPIQVLIRSFGDPYNDLLQKRNGLNRTKTAAIPRFLKKIWKWWKRD